MTEKEILSLFHHIHHFKGKHTVHHCGGKHASIDPKIDYEIFHCKCKKHAINKKTAIGHAVDKKFSSNEVLIIFQEKCPFGGWHVESGKNNNITY